MYHAGRFIKLFHEQTSRADLEDPTEIDTDNFPHPKRAPAAGIFHAPAAFRDHDAGHFPRNTRDLMDRLRSIPNIRQPGNK